MLHTNIKTLDVGDWLRYGSEPRFSGISTGLAVDPAASNIGKGSRLWHRFPPLSESGFTGFRDLQDEQSGIGGASYQFVTVLDLLRKLS